MALHSFGWMKFLLVISLASVSAYAADDPFVGTWKVNWDKSRIAGQVMEIKDLGGDKYNWVYGLDHTTFTADGKEHPSPNGGIDSLSEEAPNRWVITHKQDGHVSVEVLTLADSGQTLKAETKGTHTDGSTFTGGGEFTRIGSGSGFAGTWEVKTNHDSSTLWVIQPYGNDGLSFSSPARKERQDMKFDGKDYPVLGPDVRPGETSCAKRIDEHTIQVTDKLDGKVMSTHETVVSPDGRTITDTISVEGQKKPVILVFDKQM